MDGMKLTLHTAGVTVGQRPLTSPLTMARRGTNTRGSRTGPPVMSTASTEYGVLRIVHTIVVLGTP